MSFGRRKGYSTVMAKWRFYDFFDERLLSRLERLHLIAKRIAAHQRSGARRSRRIGDGLEFADHRAYAPGDDIRFIDWAYYARMEQLLLRLFHEHSESEVVILLDTSASMSAGRDVAKFDYARRAAAALAYVAMGGGLRVSIRAFAEDLGRTIRAGRRREHIFDVLEFLASLTPSGRTDLPACAESLARSVDTAATVMLISDLLDCGGSLPAALSRLGVKRCAVTVLHVYSPADAQPRLDGPVLLEDSETAERMSLDAAGPLLESYRNCWRTFRETCEKMCLARGATYVAAPCDLPFERLVLLSLRRSGVLAG